MRWIPTIAAALLVAASLSAGAQDAPTPDDLEDRLRQLRQQRDELVRQREEQLQQLRDALVQEQDPQERQELARRLIELQRQMVLEVRGQDRVVIDRDDDDYWQNAPVVKDPLADEPRDRVVAMLDDPDFAVRELAEHHLLADNTLDQDTLRELLVGSTSLESRYRLIRIAEHHVLRLERAKLFVPAGGPANPDNPGELRVPSAAVGFSHSQVPANENPYVNLGGVMVLATMPGFPGHAYLRAGDLIVAINGRPGRNLTDRPSISRWVSDQIGLCRPGDRIELVVIRDGRPVKVELPAAEDTALREMYLTSGVAGTRRQPRYTAVWELARLRLTEGLPVPERLTPAE